MSLSRVTRYGRPRGYCEIQEGLVLGVALQRDDPRHVNEHLCDQADNLEELAQPLVGE